MRIASSLFLLLFLGEWAGIARGMSVVRRPLLSGIKKAVLGRINVARRSRGLWSSDKDRPDDRISQRLSAWYSKVTFSWANEFMYNRTLGPPLNTKDLWKVDTTQTMSNISNRFDFLLRRPDDDESFRLFNRPPRNVLEEMWEFKLVRTLVLMHWKELVEAGFFKLLNTFMTFVPPVLVAAILSGLSASARNQSPLTNPLRAILQVVGLRGFLLSLLLFMALSMKTILDNQYFYVITNAGAAVRAAVATAVYRKLLKLRESDRYKFSTGQLMNLMQLDATRIELVVASIHLVWDGALQIFGYTLLLLWCMGPSVLIGVGALLATIPINIKVFEKISELRMQSIQKTDTRIKIINEVLCGANAVKMYGWEDAYIDKISKMRSEELKTLRRSVFLRSALGSMLSTAPSLVAALALASYAKLGNALEPAKIFTALGLFSQMRFPLLIYPTLLNTLMEGKLSMERINTFLEIPEFENYIVEETDPAVAVRLVNSTFSWMENDSVRKLGFQGNESTDLKVTDLVINKGEFVVIYGSVGSGKSMLVQAILGELIKQSGTVSRSGVVAYVSQSAWLPQDSVRNVILFGNTMRWHRYRSVLKACQLEKDLDRMDRGDRNDVGERGTGLSGGQRQRVSLARAVYENADIYLLDDPLSAQDTEVGRTILRNCILSQLKDKTRIMVSNDPDVLELADRIVLMGKSGPDSCSSVLQVGTLDELLDLGYNLTDVENQSDSMTDIPTPKLNITATDTPVAESPSVLSQSTIATQALDPLTSSEAMILSDVSLLSADVAAEVIEQDAEEDIALTESSQIFDERSRGQLSRKVYLYYLNAMKWPTALLAAFIAVILANWSTIAQQWLVSKWSKDVNYEIQSLNMYLVQLIRMACAVGLFNWIRTYLFYELGLKASKSIHSRLLSKVMSAPLSFVETTPLGRIVARFSRDLEHIDHQLPATISQLTASIVQTIAVLLSIAFVTPSFAALLLPIGAVYYFITRFYINVASDLKRLDSFTRSPIVNHFSETLSGLPLIRSFSKQSNMIRRNEGLLDENYAAGFAMKVANRWVSFRLEMLGNLIVFASATMAVASNVGSNLAGISVNNALTATSLLNWVIKNWADTESLMHSVDKEMTMIEKTAAEPMVVSKDTNISSSWPFFEVENITTVSGLIIPSTSVLPNMPTVDLDVLAENHNISRSDLKTMKQDELIASGWPWKGGIQFNNVTMRYAEDMRPVLKAVDFFVPGGSRIGIVGRSGSGKSSIFRALMRLTNIESGNIFIDGIDIAKVDLKTLRSQISVIPQDPVLFTGTIRSNIDPFGRASDDELWDVLRKSHLSVFVASLPGGLNHFIEEGGSNLSLGQRQLFCLARALLRRSRIVLLDEATSSVDADMDRLIQRTIRAEFGKGDCTVLTVAHRLRTILDSHHILVMKEGLVGEHASPSSLLEREDSLFAQLLRSSATSGPSRRRPLPPVQTAFVPKEPQSLE